MEYLCADASRNLTDEQGNTKALTFWSYKIICHTSHPSYLNPPLFPKHTTGAPSQNYVNNGESYDYCTYHRYSDFEWLVSHLQRDYPGIILPPIPDKDMDGTIDKLSEIVKKTENETSKDCYTTTKRMRHIQLFLDYLATITELHETEYVKAFFTMEGAEWLEYKKEVAARDPGFGESVKGKAMSLFHRIRDKKTEIFPPESRHGQIRTVQTELANWLVGGKNQQVVDAVGNFIIRRIKARVLMPPPLYESVEALNSPAAGLPITLTTTCNNHIAVHRGTSTMGVVRHVEGSTVWMETDGAIQSYDYESLLYPPDGMSDPVIIACNQVSTELDSFMTYFSMNQTFRDTEKLKDQMWFWGRMCQRVVATLERIAEIEQEYLYVKADTDKTKDFSKKALLQGKADALHAKFIEALNKFDRDYDASYVPKLRESLRQICLLFGDVSSKFLLDNEWGNRLVVTNNVLRECFTVPESVEEDIKNIQSRGPAHSVPPERAGAPSSYGEDAPEIPQAPAPQYKPPASQLYQQQYQQQTTQQPPSQQQQPTVAAPTAATTATTDDTHHRHGSVYHEPERGLDEPPAAPPAATDDEEAKEPVAAAAVAAMGGAEGAAAEDGAVDSKWQTAETPKFQEPAKDFGNDDEPPSLPPAP